MKIMMIAMIAKLMLLFVPLGRVDGTASRPVSSGKGRSLVPSWSQQQEERNDRSLAVISSGLNLQPISSVRNLQMLVEYEWNCYFQGTDMRCDWNQIVEDFQTKTVSNITAAIVCPDAPDSAVDFRSAKNCICDAEVERDSGEVHQCDCSICSDDRSEDVLNVDCETESEMNYLISQCKNLDCNHICNGNCTDACPPEALAEPEKCVTCPRPTESPTSSSRPTSVATTVPPAVAPSAATGTPTGELPTATPSASQLPTESPNTPTSDIETEVPTAAPAPTVPTAETVAPSGPSVAPVVLSPPTPTLQQPTISPKPTVSGEVALGTFVVDYDEFDDEPDQLKYLSAALTEYLRKELQSDYPNMVELIIQELNTGYGTVEYQAHGVFSADGSIPPMDEMIQNQRAILENEAKYADFMANANSDFSRVNVRQMNAEGPAPRGQRSVEAPVEV